MEPADEIAAPRGRQVGSRSGRRLTVALDITAAGQTAGIGRYTRGLASALLSRGAHEYVAFSARGSARQGMPGLAPGARVVHAPLPARLMTILWHRAGLPWPAESLTGPVDVFHATDFLAPPLRRAASVITVHDLSFLVCPDKADPRLVRFLAGRVPASARKADHVLADSRCTKQDLIARAAVAENRITVAYPALERSFGRGVGSDHEAAVRHRYSLTGPFLLGVGTLEPRKNWPALMSAFAAANLPEATLVIAGGPGWGSERLETVAWSTQAPVRLLGFVPDDDLAPLYRSAQAFATVSQYEGFGLPLLEAMACGTPCVTSDGGSLPEVAGNAALIVPAGNESALVAALRRAWGDVDERRRLAAEGPNQAARFDWDATARVVEDAYLLADARAQSRSGG